MAFFKRVNLQGPKGEKLQGWVAERHADIGASFRLVEDEKLRVFTVTEAADQLLLESQIDPRHLLNPIEPVSESNVTKLAKGNGAAVPEAILRQPRKKKSKVEAAPETPAN